MSEKERCLIVEALDRQLSLPFDQYQRYRIVTDVLGRLREGPLRILDVGGGEGIILNFLPEDEVTILDQFDAEAVPGFVKGDATALPFENDAFDYVVSVDVYEHIAPEARDAYLSELRRTARKGVLLAAPFDSAVVRNAERLANEFNRAVHLSYNVWLQEHVENGLPALSDAERFFEARGDDVSVLPNGYIPHWLAMICLTFYKPKLGGELGEVFDRVNSFYNEFMYELDNAEPCYRRLLVSLKEPANANLNGLASPERDPEHASRSLTLFGALSAVLPLAADANRTGALLNRFERHLARKEGALARKEAQVDDLSRRLAERVSVGTARQGTADLQSSTNIEKQNAVLKRQRDEARRRLAGITASRSWRLLNMLHRAALRARRAVRPGG